MKRSLSPVKMPRTSLAHFPEQIVGGERIVDFLFGLCWFLPGLSLIAAAFAGTTLMVLSGTTFLERVLLLLGVGAAFLPFPLTLGCGLFAAHLQVARSSGRADTLLNKAIMKKALSFWLIQILFAPAVALVGSIFLSGL